MRYRLKPAPNTSQAHFRVCNLCEAMCGLRVDHVGREVTRVQGDVDDPFSQGAICPKGALIAGIYDDPDRLRRPLRKTRAGFKEIGWDEALDLAGEGLLKVRDAHGDDALALYMGNPTVHNLGSMLYSGHLKQALHSKNVFTPTSMDQLPHHFAAHHMFGHSMLVPIPDIDRTDYALIMGANPLASNGSIMSAPGVGKRLAAISKKGGKWVVFDPRRTESAERADEHLPIRPGTDVYFLLSLLHVLTTEHPDLVQRLPRHFLGLDQISQIADGYSPEATADRTGVPAPAARRLAREYLTADRAVIYGRFGVCTQRHGGLNLWLINLLNILSGNFDRPGGAMFPTPAVDVIRRDRGREQGRWKSRVRGVPEFEGELPVSVLLEEMNTGGPGQIRSLITLCGNPVLASPGGQRLSTALAKLDFMVSIDIFLNETTRHADLILPPTTGLEIDHYDLIFNAFAVRNVAKFSPQLTPRHADQRHDWEILKGLISRISHKPPGWFFRWATPRRLLNLGLLTGPYGKLSSVRRLFSGLSLGKVEGSVHGIDLGPLQPRLPGALGTRDKKVHLAPPVFIEHLGRLREEFNAGEGKLMSNEFRLIGRRHVRDNNSWMHNVPKLMTGKPRCTLTLHSGDAARLGLQPGSQVRVTSSAGVILLMLETNDAVMPGVASIPHGYGHGHAETRMRVAGAHAGASVNDLTDPLDVDPVTQNAAFTGLVVRVEPAQ